MPVWREEMAKKKVGAYITLDGEKEFRSAVTQCNKSLSTMKSEMKLVEAETAGNANSVDTLRKKNEVLTRTLDKQVEKEEAVRKGLTHAQEDYARVGTELQEYRTKLEQAQSTLDEMKQSSDVSEEALSRQQEAVSELTEKVEKGEATYQRAGNRVEDWQKQLNNAQAQTIKATRAVNENTAYLEEAEKATDGCAKSIDKFGKQTDDVAEGATVAQAGFNAVLAANPAILVVAGVTALIGVTAVLASKMGDATSETDELIQSTSELKDKASETSEALKQATQNMTSSMEEVNASGTLANNLTDELVKLAGQSNQTTEQQSRMKTIVMELNTMFPEMSLAIDETTGKLSMSSEEMKNYIKSALEMQKIQVAQEKMKDSVEKLVDAEVEKADAENKVSEIGEKLAAIEAKRSEVNDVLREKTEATKEAQEKYSEALKKGADNVDELYAATQDQSEATIEYNGNIVTVTEALRQMADDERELNDAKQTAKDSQKEINDAIKEANAEMEPYMSYLSDMTEETNNNTAATKNNTSAKTEATEQSSVSITMAGQELEAYQNLSVSQQELAVNVTNSVLTMQENVQSALKSQMDMFEEFDAGTQISTENLLANMQSQVDGVTAWEQNLSALADRGINQGILQKLSEMGPQGSGYVAAFNSMTDEELKKANDLWSQSVDIQGMTNEWGQQLLTSGAANIAGGMDGLTSVMQESGTNTVMGLVQGMQNAQEKANAAGKDLGVKTVEAVNNGLGCQSPSKKTRESGKNVDLGLVQGMKNGESNVKTEARSVASGAINVFAAQCTASKTQLYGYNLSIGLANGISDGRSAVISAASRVASDAIATAKKKLEINSPSKVFWRMGQYSMQGLANGVTENSLLAQNAVKEAVDYSGTSMTFGNMAENEYTQYKALRNIIKDAVKDLQIRAYLGEREVTRTLSDWGVVFNA